LISHPHKCIFIHIARTAGTSIEHSIIGKDWWRVDPSSKHISVQQTITKFGKDVYNDYFTFTVIRNPWDRIISMWQKKWWSNKQPMSLPAFLKQLKPNKNEHYKSLFYHEILNGPVDFIVRFENLQEDMNYVFDKIGMPRKVLPHITQSKHRCHYTTYYDEETRTLVASMFKTDIEMFGYHYESPAC